MGTGVTSHKAAIYSQNKEKKRLRARRCTCMKELRQNQRMEERKKKQERLSFAEVVIQFT